MPQASSVNPRMGKKRAFPRVLCIVGPTAAGKTVLGIALAKVFNGEVINADARQVYREFDIGTSKPSRGKAERWHGKRMFVVDGIPHHLMDFLAPQKVTTVAEWRRKAMKAVREITARGKLPIVVGGTGLYVQALIDNYKIPHVLPQEAYRQAMEPKTTEELVVLLQHADPEAARTVDLKNRRRVLRALEVVTFTGKPFSKLRSKARPVVDAFLIGPARSKEELHGRIDQAIENMFTRGWADEVRRLHAQGVPWDAPAMSSIGYREMGAFVRGEVDIVSTKEKIKRATRQYAKRQWTWFKRDTRIQWMHEEKEAEKGVREWLITESQTDSTGGKR